MDINTNLKGEEAMELFSIIKQNNLLPETVDKLVPLSFIGQAAVGFYRSKIKLMDQLNMTEAQRKATLSDGQDAGEMLLDIETRIGELAAKELKVPAKIAARLPNGRVAVTGKSGQPPKHERLGIPQKRMEQSQAIAKHPEIVEKVKTQAKENEDIPTKSAVFAEIRHQKDVENLKKEKKRRAKAEKEHEEIKAVVSIEQTQYLMALDRCIHLLPQKPPERWNDTLLKEAKAKAKIIIKRLEVFNNG